MNLSEVDLRNIYRRWHKGLGEFQCFFRSSPFVSLQTYDDFIIDEEDMEESCSNIISIILEHENNKSFLIVDLPLNKILDLALILNNEEGIKPILNINLLFHLYGIVGTKNNINKLIVNSLKLKNIESDKYIMLIPYDRFQEGINLDRMKNKLNNQFGIGEEELPYQEMLKKLGYDKLVLITEGNVKEDLLEYIEYMKKDMKVEVIKVG
ncbi:normocyte-binding protein [Clostridium paraputrificum]|uniref:normocyte-binding protein n=1 Tax=Clostridium paraputrificum TaxID=29363 RepID=UPI003D324A77